jgi:class 3 adenylate cyclase
MPKFSPERFPPGFFDLPADAGETLPLDVISAWTRSAQTLEVARGLLAPFTLRGLLVCSDAAGLTRLTQERSLIEILAMVSRPKELIHAYGRAIGGQAVGVWAADNTAMFYPAGVNPDHVIGMLLAVHDQVRAECEIGIGIAAHRGTFYELGRGIFGPDADRIEAIAEDFTTAGELVVTGECRAALGETAAFSYAPRDDLRESFGEVLRVTDGPRLAGIEASDFHYPLPFSEEFFSGLGQFKRTRRTSVVPRPAYRECAIVVLEREAEERDVPELATLNDLAMAAAVKRIGAGMMDDLAGIEVKTTGLVGIYLFEEPRHAVAFARKLRQVMAEQRMALRMGIDVGRVLLFELGGGTMDLAGGPVNIASKLAQDLGTFGGITLSAEAARRGGVTGGMPRTGRAGGVEIELLVI